MEKKKVMAYFQQCLGILLIVFSPLIGNIAESTSIYNDITRSYFNFIAFTISTSILGLAMFLSGVIGLYMISKK